MKNKGEKLQCRDNSYFNDKDTYLFRNSLNQEFYSKVERDEEGKGNWFTADKNRPRYKATSLPCVVVNP